MKKKILVLEDNLVELEDFKQFLGEEYDVFPASRTDIADEILTKYGNEIDCVVFDLNISSEFLATEHKEKTVDGTLTGWIWYFYNAKCRLKEDTYAMISSGFMNEFSDYISENCVLSSSEEKQFYNEYKDKKIICVSKRSIINEYEAVANEIARRLST